ncbi:MAG: hypothetical protein LBV72_05405 [Tannerella sp.]|jgi:hypothetical protein|nr:hypothetical protein [Tannerella sp.]
MKTNNRGRLAIEITECSHRVIFLPKDGTVWMTRNELCELFDCYMKDIDNALFEIFQRGLYEMEDVCKYNLIMKGKRVTYEITELNLEIIIILAFYLDSFYSKVLREWVIKRCLKYNELGLKECCVVQQNYQLN